LLLGGVVASLLKGLDFEEATYLFAVLLALLPARRRFSRHASLLAEPLTRSWTVAIVAVLSASVWLVLFGHRHVRFANDVWGHVVIIKSTRALWVTSAAVVAAGLLGLLRLLRPAQPRSVAPDALSVARAQTIARSSPTAVAHLSLVGDKSLLFGARGNSFLMYGISGRSWIAMSDPVGDPAERSALAWHFRELAAAHAADAAFYLVAPENLPLYVEMGLRLFKMGETARVPLATFTLDGGAQKWLRRARRQVIDAGCTLAVLAPGDVASALDQMQRVSDAWMATRRAREKRFSLGYFDAEYLKRCSLAVVRRGDAIVAFANLWLGARGGELSVDLVRYAPTAPPGLTDFLYSELFRWGRENGYSWFDLGMAPLSGLQPRALAPLWHRAGNSLYRNGRRLYNFEGLRRYKEKFDPVWEPRYLATPGGVAVPRVLSNLVSLISDRAVGRVTA
jgi:phosphatidylglycerol lysyltransferase